MPTGYSGHHQRSGKTPADKLGHYSMPEPNSGCTLWLAQVDSRGYGCTRWRGKACLAHRLAWESAHGPIPAGMFVCHKCDVRSCINPDHLFLGTHTDNMRDMVAKGRGRQGSQRGERNAQARLTLEQVAAVRADKRSRRLVAAAFGISKSHVSHIRAGHVWRPEDRLAEVMRFERSA